jgi:peptidoglycan/LPS O-acetylase OafA/YrhL
MSSDPASWGTTRRLEYLDSVRGMAALAVLFGHYFGGYGRPPFVPAWAWNTPVAVVRDGEAAVAMFFVLSGLVLSLKYVRLERPFGGGWRDLAAFFVARVARILPAFLGALWSSALLKATVFQTYATVPPATVWLRSFWNSPPGLLDPLKQSVLVFPWGGERLIPQDWSLTVELNLSLWMPFLILLATHGMAGLVFFAVVGIALLGVQPFLLPFVMGIALAWFFEPIRESKLLKRPAVLSMLIAAGLFLYAFRFTQLLLPAALQPTFERNWVAPGPSRDFLTWHVTAAGAAMILVALIGTPRLQRVLHLRLLTYLGRISYSVYLWHFAVLLCFTPRLLHWLNAMGLESPAMGSSVGLAGTVLATVLVSDVSYRLVEKPGIAFGRRVNRRLLEAQWMSQPVAPRRVLRRAALGAIVFVGWMALVLVVTDYVVARRFVAKIRRKDIPVSLLPTVVPPATARRVGLFKNFARSSFVQARPEKAAGVVRVCAFGDSFTAGDETDATHDYPSLLGALFRRHGLGHVEVLNFGSSSFGFHQSFILWKDLAVTYGCDRVLLGPATFFPDRDTTFSHFGLPGAYYLHARYVLDGADVKLVEVVGDTVEERFEEFFRFIPHLAYVRYEPAAPVFLRAWVPEGRELRNPFYYDRRFDIGAEAFDTYRILLGHMAAAGKDVVLGGQGRIVSIAREVNMPKLHAFTTAVPNAFPYLAPRNHYGPFGNEMLALQYLAALTGDGGPLLVLRSEPIPPPDVASGTAAARQPLAAFDAVAVALQSVDVGHFVTGTLATNRSGSPDLLRTSQVVSLVAVGGPPPSKPDDEGSAVDGCFLALERPLEREEPVALDLAGPQGRSTLTIGRVELFDPGISLGSVRLDSLRIRDTPFMSEEHKLVLAERGGKRLDGRIAGSPSITLRIGATPLLTGHRVGADVVLSPIRGSCYRLRANREGHVVTADLPDAGTYDLVLRKGGAVTRVPLAGWRKATVGGVQLAPPLAPDAALAARP